MTTLNEARMPSLADKLEAKDIERVIAETEVPEVPKKGRITKKNKK